MCKHYVTRPFSSPQSVEDEAMADNEKKKLEVLNLIFLALHPLQLSN